MKKASKSFLGILIGIMVFSSCKDESTMNNGDVSRMKSPQNVIYVSNVNGMKTIPIQFVQHLHITVVFMSMTKYGIMEI
ncbi:MAG: hypothetical protein LBT04_07775 [Prevotellaceae bacterium]|jgi:hypothetical protein|nr:hypothetical protein [Prevotellaceae bacterium]